MRLTEAREGKTKTQILATVAEAQRDDEPPIQKDLVETLPMTKGAVSQNCSWLVEQSFLQKIEGRYSIDTNRLLNDYREHFEEYLRRKPKSDLFHQEVKRTNETRTQTKRSAAEYFESDHLEDILLTALINSLEKNNIQTLREVFLHTDNVLYHIAYRAATSDIEPPEDLRPILALASCLDSTTDLVEGFANRNDLREELDGNSPAVHVSNYAHGGA